MSKTKAKTKFRVIDGPRPIEPAPAPAPVPPAASAVQDVEDKKVYAFPTKSRCPKCESLATRRRGPNRDRSVQYRQCLRPSCRTKYSIQGIPV